MTNDNKSIAMKQIKLLILFVCVMLGHNQAFAQETANEWREVVINIVETSDVHGNFYPYNFIERKPWSGSLARVHSFLKEQREIYGNNLLLFDNGDILQGQPTAYYYDYLAADKPHVAAEMLNYLGCNLGTLGNHDLETGHAVYDNWIKQCKFPVLGANIVDAKTGEPYLKPYEVFERDGVKIAVLGLITESIPCWLPEVLWSGLKFEPMLESAKKWVNVIKTKEQPDVLIGLFHSGRDGQKLGNMIENASQLVAENVRGFDVILFGHDHSRFCQVVETDEWDDIMMVNPGNNANYAASVKIIVRKHPTKNGTKEVQAKLVDLSRYAVSEEFMDRFGTQFDEVNDFVNRKIGTIDRTIYSREAFFGSSEFVDLLHSLQLELTGADVSFCAPLSATAKIAEGDIHVSDMFSLYRFENMLYTMKLTGQEIKDYLEMSYDLWTNQMTSPGDHILLIESDPKSQNDERYRFKNMTFNFDSAAGIKYTVDVTKPRGEKINIISMANGGKFYLDKVYKCAINSYRGNGGGDLLTKGAGIPSEELASRIISSTEKDLRYYLMKHIEKAKTLKPRALNQWKFVPENWAEPALDRDRKLVLR